MFPTPYTSDITSYNAANCNDNVSGMIDACRCEFAKIYDEAYIAIEPKSGKIVFVKV